MQNVLLEPNASKRNDNNDEEDGNHWNVESPLKVKETIGIRQEGELHLFWVFF